MKNAQRTAKMSDVEFYDSLRRLVALVGDAHPFEDYANGIDPEIQGLLAPQ